MEYRGPEILGVIAHVEKGTSAKAVLKTVTAAGLVGGKALEIIGVVIGGVPSETAGVTIENIREVDGITSAEFEHPLEATE